MTTGDRLPELRTAIPGPRSRALARRLREVESRNITHVGEDGPIFWAGATGANVVDADGNTFVDLTAGFGVAAAGHGNPAVADAVATQAGRLLHAMGDVHPAETKVALLERLAALAPGDLSVGILAANGGDAVEAALKTAHLVTGRPGIVAFEGGYHGLGYGALAVTAHGRFRRPFERQLYAGVGFAPYPASTGDADADAAAGAASLAGVRRLVEEAGGGADAIGAVIVEPVQGRGGIVVPPSGFLGALKSLCRELDVLLVLDEIYTGLGRTGRWFACQHEDVVPDLLVIGKALAGGLPLSAVLGSRALMDAWPPSTGEAIHTSTFLGNPVTCAAALAHLDQIESHGLVERAERLGRRLGERLAGWVGTVPGVVGARGIGLMRAAALGGDDAAERAPAIVAHALRAGVILLPEGPALAFTPPLTITEAQLDHALGVVEEAIRQVSGRRSAGGPGRDPSP